MSAGPSVSLAADDSNDPVHVVQSFEETLVSVMKNAEQLGYPGRYEQLSASARASHDFQTIARVSVGKFWKQLENDQQNRLVDTFTELSVATYADRFARYSGERFKIVSQRRFGKDRALVRSVMSKPGGKKRNFDFMLKRFDGVWKIVNITVNGVSDLAVKRIEFQSVIEESGFDALMVRLREKIARYEAGS